MDDVVTLSRAQFALTIMFHYLFPPLSIGLGLIMTLLEARYLWKKDEDDHALARFLTKLFAANFAVGVATGIVMEFQFGTNWATYSRFVGDVFGSALASEGIFAFFLESGFLAVLVFGWDRVGKKMHFFATAMVFLGSVFSSVWIVIASSWMHTPAGHHIVNRDDGARAEITDFWAMVFNPSSMERLTHVLIGAFILGAFFVMSVCAFYILKQRHRAIAEKGFSLALGVAFVTSLAMLASGHSQANAVARNQPPKLAAFEGHWKTGPAPLYVLGWPDVDAKEVRFGLGVPGMLSVLVHDDPNVPIEGLDETPKEDQPPVVVPFVTYHVMAMLGFSFIGLTSLGVFLRWRRRLFEQRWLMMTFVGAVILPYIANQAGWVAAEVGRQPWVVYKLLRTKDAISKVVPAEHIITSIVLFSLIYMALFAVWIFVMNEKIQHGPDLPHGEKSESFLDVAAARPDKHESMT